ncbi:hypothetical protein [Salinigranum marinum]|uniref:DUF7860 family protein n=1 Tax=Salinigranum marinum TaxID=1515595 RepID=UPI002989FD50|nr:hypothetical protein [Salinigranum marinum]
MSGRYGDIDYPRVTKLGVLAGATLFILGLLGEVVGAALFGPLPAWEHTLFFDMEAVGIVLVLVVPFVFGVALPLTE